MKENAVIFTRVLLPGLLSLLLILPAAAHAESYSYDSTGRLIAVTYDDGSSISYRYDASGNRLDKTAAALTAAPDPGTGTTTGSSSGGGCSVGSPGDAVDPSIPLLVLLAVAGLLRRRRPLQGSGKTNGCGGPV